MPFLPPPKPDVAHTAVAENSAVCGDACDATRNRFHRPDKPRHTAAARQKHDAHHSGASLAAETMLRRTSCADRPWASQPGATERRVFQSSCCFHGGRWMEDVVQRVRGAAKTQFQGVVGG